MYTLPEANCVEHLPFFALGLGSRRLQRIYMQHDCPDSGAIEVNAI